MTAAIPVMMILIGFEIFNRSRDASSIYFKRKFLLENTDQIDGLIFGPSHSMRALHPKYFDYTIATLAVPGSAPNIDYHFYEYAMRKCEPRFVIFDLSVGYLRKFNDRSWIEGRKLPYYFGNFAGGIWSHFLSRYPLKEHFGAEEQEKYDRWGQPVEISAKKDIFARLSYRDSLILQHSKTTYTFEKQQLPKDPKRLRSNTGLYRKIIEECTARGIKVVFVSPPKYHLYNSGINQDYEYERTAFLQDIVDNDNVYFLNYENALEKQSRLFYNVNHLNQEGAGIFSKELNEVLKKIMDGRHVKSLSGAINIPPRLLHNHRRPGDRHLSSSADSNDN